MGRSRGVASLLLLCVASSLLATASCKDSGALLPSEDAQRDATSQPDVNPSAGDGGVSDTSDGAIGDATGAEVDADAEVDAEVDARVAVCGDGIVEGDEFCDDSGDSATCNANCTPAECGDQIVNPMAGEECDANELCTPECKRGFVQYDFDVGLDVRVLTVPAGVTKLRIEAWGASGGNCAPAQGGTGGLARATFDVAAGDLLEIRLGGAGANAQPGVRGGALGGANGGGRGGHGGFDSGGISGGEGAGGGGASDVRRNGSALADRILVAGGGGGGSGPDYYRNGGVGAGAGGLATSGGEGAAGQGGRPGTAEAGGAGGVNQGVNGGAGTLGVGGAAISSGVTGCGGGGAGYYGGGGGAGAGGGGGGGSSYVGNGADSLIGAGVRGNGSVRITWVL